MFAILCDRCKDILYKKESHEWDMDVDVSTYKFSGISKRYHICPNCLNIVIKELKKEIEHMFSTYKNKGEYKQTCDCCSERRLERDYAATNYHYAPEKDNSWAFRVYIFLGFNERTRDPQRADVKHDYVNIVALSFCKECCDKHKKEMSDLIDKCMTFK